MLEFAALWFWIGWEKAPEPLPPFDRKKELHEALLPLPPPHRDAAIEMLKKWHILNGTAKWRC